MRYSIPFVTLLSKLGLNASPLNSVTSSGWPANFPSELAYELHSVWNRAMPPTGSREPGSTW